MDVLEQVRKAWLLRGVKVRAGIDPNKLDSFEAKHHIKLPAEVKRFYQLMDGMDDNCSDGTEQLFAFWRFERLEPREPKFSTDARFAVAFADSLLESNVYYFLVANDQNDQYRIVDEHGRELADALEEFLRKYLEDPGALL